MTSTRRSGGPIRRRRWMWCSVGLGLVLGAAGWVAWTGLKARTALTVAAEALPAAKTAVLSGDSAAAAQRLGELRVPTQAAYDATHDPVWAVAARVPLLGRPFATVRGVTEAVNGLGRDALPALSLVASSVKIETLLSAGTVNVQALSAAAGPLGQAADALDRERAGLEQVPASWVPQLSRARSQLLGELAPLSRSTRSAATAARLVPPMLGVDGLRRYFLGFQNPAEARGTGGLLDAFAIVAVEGGRITVERVGSNAQLPPPRGDLEQVSPDFLARYQVQGATRLWVNTNLSPDFAEVAPVWLAMWRSATGEQLDGAIALDPAALADVLAATGPVTAAGVGEVTAAAVVPLVLEQQYLLTDQVAQRKTLMVGVGQAAVQAVLAGRAPPRPLVQALSKAARERHLLVYSRDAGEQAGLRSSRLTGEVAATAAPFAQAVMVNAAGSKLDAYLDQRLDYRVNTCNRGRRAATVTVTLTNSAPSTPLPPYVTIRADRPAPPVPVGQNRVSVQVLLTRGARVMEAALDRQGLRLASPPGEPPKTLQGSVSGESLDAGEQAGRPSYGLELELPVGIPRVLTLKVEEPPTSLAPVLPVQSLARPPQVTSEVSACAGL